MRANAERVRLSASDLSNHLACAHLTVLDLSVATGAHSVPKWNSPDAWVLQQQGIAHENAYIENLKSQGLSIVDLREIKDEARAIEDTRAAMQAGADVIVQGALVDGSWFGRADVLRKIAQPSRLGNWSYAAYDCKLAQETKAGTILQLCLYSELLGSIQEKQPEFMYVVPPNDGFIPEPYRVYDFAAYYRYVKRRLQSAVGKPDNSYPEPAEHCPVCRWSLECDEQRRQDDHLSLVADISRLQRKQLAAWNVTTIQNLSVLPLPLQHRPERGSKNGYVRIREQARVQVMGRDQEKPIFEVLQLNEQHGFYGLPEPTPGDVFFDLESDPFVGRVGREYLFGFTYDDGNGGRNYDYRWAITAEEEKLAFEWFVDRVIAQWARYPTMHVYHFTGYEVGALKRLMGRYTTREEEIDRMLRARLFVDLHTIVKRAVRASVEQYSLKVLEAFHGFERKMALEDARHAMRQIQHHLELGEVGKIDESLCETLIHYNADDCNSTWSLRTWLENLRRSCEQAGNNLRRPTPGDGAPPENVDERQQRSAALASHLLEGVPSGAHQRNDEQAARWLLSNLLDWHRRELKSEWWEYYRLGDLSDEELLDEKSALSGLSLTDRLGVQRNIPTDRYSFEKQETDVRTGDELCARGEKIGEAIGIDLAARTIDLKKTKKTADVHPSAMYVKDIGPGTDILAEAIYRIGAWVAANGMEAQGPHRAARDLILRRAPRLTDGSTTLIVSGETTLEAAKRLGTLLDHSTLAIQGPPGAGKTFTGARMIGELVRQGKRVGITATSHKVISNLLKETITAAVEANIDIRCVQKVKKEDKPEQDPPHLVTTLDNKETRAAFLDGANVLAGTQWLWAQQDYFEAVDVLFVDEAGQMSLANVLAVAQATKNLVLLGDPQQLEQPLKGSHPDGADVSALEHLLDGAKTISAENGLFLESTWRLHPSLCGFTSEVFYDSRLSSHEGLEQQRIVGHPWLGQAGLWFVPVTHEGNQNSSPEEVEVVAKLVQDLTHASVRWIDSIGQSRPLQLEDILIVAPYSAQVSDLADRIPNARIGTVDKFQGQQAPLVIYSLTTSTPEDAPRGMEFLYSLNRLNVATSRAQAMVIIVGSPHLLKPECRSPRQMLLANALCRYAELARIPAPH
jgi:predicted RecB family nuclease